MALREFWSNVFNAVGLVSPTVTGPPSVDPANVEKALARADLWLTPNAVDGYNEADFADLPDGERAELTEAVNGFLRIARQVPPDGPATPEQARTALTSLHRVVATLDRDRYADADAFAAGKAIERSARDRLPQWVRQLRFETRSDVGGDPGLWVWVVADDAELQPDRLRQNTATVRRILEQASSQLGSRYSLYVRFQGTGEQTTAMGSQR